MNPIFDFFLDPYKGTPLYLIMLEFLAFVFGIASVLYAKKEKILVYPTGIIATIITTYLLYKAEYIGDMMMNFYYSMMSFYGWWNWSRKKGNIFIVPISRTNTNEKLIGFGLFIVTMIVTYIAYRIGGYTIETENYLDIFTSGIFFTAMWYMANKKLENWTLWIIGDLITVPLYAYRGLGILSLQYLIFTILAIQGYLAWKEQLNAKKTIVGLAQEPSNNLKFVLFGPESTGKTTLAKKLAAHFNTHWVPEYMREYLQKKWDTKKQTCEIDDLLPIAKGQMKRENELSSKSDSLLFCDTNLLEIQVYSRYYYNGFCPPDIQHFASQNTYAHYFLTYIDTDWIFDDLRDRPDNREEIFRIFEAQLNEKDLSYTVLKGTEEERFKNALRIIEEMKEEQDAI